MVTSTIRPKCPKSATSLRVSIWIFDNANFLRLLQPRSKSALRLRPRLPSWIGLSRVLSRVRLVQPRDHVLSAHGAAVQLATGRARILVDGPELPLDLRGGLLLQRTCFINAVSGTAGLLRCSRTLGLLVELAAHVSVMEFAQI